MREKPVTCDEIEPLMLESLYGLASDATTAAVRAHAAGCPACAGKLREAERAQALFQKAARLNFPDVRFSEPDVELAKPSRSLVRTWLPWAVAAAVILGVGGLGLRELQSPNGSPPREVAAISTEQDKTKSNTGVTVPPRSIRETVQGEWSARTAAESTAPFQLLVLGPSVPHDAAASEYSVTATDASGKPLTVRVTATLAGADFKQAFETPHTLTLPAGAWLKRAKDAKLQFTATHPVSLERVTLSIP